jgi:putative transposase
VTFDGLHWYVSVGIEVSAEPVELTGESVGIDVGVKYLAVCSNNKEPYKNINKTQKVKKTEKKLCRLQRKVSNKYEKNKKGESYVKL